MRNLIKDDKGVGAEHIIWSDATVVHTSSGTYANQANTDTDVTFNNLFLLGN